MHVNNSIAGASSPRDAAMAAFGQAGQALHEALATVAGAVMDAPVSASIGNMGDAAASVQEATAAMREAEALFLSFRVAFARLEGTLGIGMGRVAA